MYWSQSSLYNMSKTKKVKETVENGALEVSSTSSPPKKRPCLKVRYI
jgi:hypothetical protein